MGRMQHTFSLSEHTSKAENDRMTDGLKGVNSENRHTIFKSKRACIKWMSLYAHTLTQVLPGN